MIEREKYILPSFDNYLGNRIKTILTKKGIKIDTGKDLSEYDLGEYDERFSAVGRMPNLESLKVENAGLSIKDGGWIETNSSLKTNIDNIYACGDITGKELLAYIAEYQAEIVVDNIKGDAGEEDYSGIPECVFSIPQVAKVGVLEQEAKEKNIGYRIIKSNFRKFSSPYVYDDLDGFIEILIDDKERIIGAGIISQSAAELISVLSVCVKNKMCLSDLKKCTFIHPTLSEIIPLSLRI